MCNFALCMAAGLLFCDSKGTLFEVVRGCRMAYLGITEKGQCPEPCLFLSSPEWFFAGGISEPEYPPVNDSSFTPVPSCQSSFMSESGHVIVFVEAKGGGK